LNFQIHSTSLFSKKYGSYEAVKGISFFIEKGRITGLLGPNGAGKSTTMKMITGYLKPDGGKVEISNLNVVDHPLEVKQRIGYLPENNPLYPEMYITEYLQFLSGLHHISDGRRRIEKVIYATGLEKERKKRIGELSKGFRQRVGLAQALIHNPDVLILDEPTSGLDPNQIVEIRELIKKLGKEKTVILSTHIMQEVQAICEDVIIMDGGEIVAMDKLENLSLQGQNQLIKVGFHSPFEINSLWEIDGVIKVIQLDDTLNQFEIYYNSKIDIRLDIFNKAVEFRNPILEMKLLRKSMENIFEEFTGAKR